jgi:hypothetical protein
MNLTTMRMRAEAPILEHDQIEVGSKGAACSCGDDTFGGHGNRLIAALIER